MGAGAGTSRAVVVSHRATSRRLEHGRGTCQSRVHAEEPLVADRLAAGLVGRRAARDCTISRGRGATRGNLTVLKGSPQNDAPNDRPARVAPALFLSLFAGQAALIAISPVLAEVASDFGVSTATAGQLRSLSGLAAGTTALALGGAAARLGLRDLLALGLLTLAVGSIASAAAPTFAVLAAAQVIVGAGIAVVLSAGLAAAAAWSTPDRRAAVLSWALLGQPVAWIVGMPLVGATGDVSWRLAWIGVPLLAAVLAAIAVVRHPADRPAEPTTGSWRLLRRNPTVAGWALGELLAFSAWAGTLVFAGALLVESYGIGVGGAGLLLGLAAVAYLPGNLVARRWVEGSSRRMLASLPLAAGAVVAAFGAWRPGAGASFALFALLAFVAAGRTIAGSALGLEVCSQRRVFAMRIRAAATQFGYLLGAALGGLALATGGYALMGWTFATLFLLAALPHAVALRSGGAESRLPGAPLR